MSVDRDLLEQNLRAARARYDALAPGDKARLRRCKDADDVLLEGAYWRVAGSSHRVRLPSVVLLFAEAPHRKMARFSFGRFLKQRLPTSEESRNLRFRRAIESDRDELTHRLRGLIRLASKREYAVDWGVLGVDIILFGDHVRRRWTQDFFAPEKQASMPNPETT